MKFGGALSVLSHIINFAILIYFSVVLLRLNALDVIGLLISAFGLFASLVANIVSVLGEK